MCFGWTWVCRLNSSRTLSWFPLGQLKSSLLSSASYWVATWHVHCRVIGSSGVQSVILCKVTQCENAASSQRHRTLQPRRRANELASSFSSSSFASFALPSLLLFSWRSLWIASCSFSILLYFPFSPFNFTPSLSPSLHVQYCDWRKCGHSMRNRFYLWSMAFHSAASRIGPQNECQFNALLYTLSPVIFGSLCVSDFDRLHFSSLVMLQHLCLCEKMRRDSLLLIYAALSLALAFRTKSLLSLKSQLTLQKLWL